MKNTAENFYFRWKKVCQLVFNYPGKCLVCLAKKWVNLFDFFSCTGQITVLLETYMIDQHVSHSNCIGCSTFLDFLCKLSFWIYLRILYFKGFYIPHLQKIVWNASWNLNSGIKTAKKQLAIPILATLSLKIFRKKKHSEKKIWLDLIFIY